MTRSIALILDPAFGDRISEVSRQMPVWVLSSSINDPVVRFERARFAEGHITALLPRDQESPAELLARAMCAVDEHHGEESQTVPYDTLRVIGTNEIPSNELTKDLKFKSLVKTSEGFEATK